MSVELRHFFLSEASSQDDNPERGGVELVGPRRSVVAPLREREGGRPASGPRGPNGRPIHGTCGDNCAAWAGKVERLGGSPQDDHSTGAVGQLEAQDGDGVSSAVRGWPH
jgi:hypothetical protein